MNPSDGIRIWGGRYWNSHYQPVPRERERESDFLKRRPTILEMRIPTLTYHVLGWVEFRRWEGNSNGKNGKSIARE